MLPRLLLIGAGPAHLHALHYLARRKTPARETLLVAGAPTIIKPGMIAGFLAGRYRTEEVVLDLARLAHAAGGELAVGTVASIEPGSRTARLEEGRALLYNAASIALEDHPASAGVPGALRHARFIHSVSQVMSLVPALEQTLSENTHPVFRILVVGSGVAAFEVAMAFRRQLGLLSKHPGTVTIVSASPVLWGERGSAARLCARALRRNQITLIMGTRVRDVAQGQLQLSSGARVGFDFLVWAGDGDVPRFLQSSGLPASRDGALLVDSFLQSTAGAGLFAAGVTAALVGHPGPDQEGADPARQGAVLGQNLLRVLEGKLPDRTYDPPTRPFSWAATADDRAILSCGRFAAEGHWVSRLKEKRERTIWRTLPEKNA